MKPAAMFFRLFFILMASIPLIKTQPYPYQNTYSNSILQPSNNNAYYQTPKVQNPPQIDPAALQETLNQFVFSKYLSNPTFKTILEPNSKLLSQHGEIQKQGPDGHIPSVVNNYFIVPPEFFNLNDTLVRKNGKNNPKVKRKKKQEVKEQVIKEDSPKDGLRKKKRRKKIKPQNIAAVPNPNEDVILVSDERNPKKRKRIKLNNKKEKLRPKPRPEKLIDISEAIDDNAAKQSKKLRRKKPKPNVDKELVDNLKNNHDFQEIVDYTPIKINTENIETEKPKLMTRRRFPKVNEIEDTNNKHLKNIEEPVDNSEKNNDLTENRKIRNSKKRKDSIDQGFPPLPEEVIKSFYPYLNQFYGNNMPFNYEQFYNAPPYSRNSERTNRRKSNRTEKPKANTVNVRYKPKTIPESKVTENMDKKIDLKVTNEKEIHTTTEKTIKPEEVTEVTTKIPEETKTTKEDIITKDNYEIENDEIEDSYSVSELRENIPYNNFIDDYYPMFHDQSLYSNEHDEQAIRNDESRYYYNTEVADLVRDRSINDRREKYKHKPFEKDAELIDREGIRSTFQDNSMNLEDNPKILEKLSNIEQEIVEEKEPTFKTPPGLENPDFKTRNIKDFEEPKEFNSKDVQLDKLSVFSSTKTDILPEIKRIRVPGKNTRPKTEEIETYFANSKVVKYGVPQDSVESNESISVSNENEERENDGHTTYVVAKSLGKVDDYYW